MRQQTRASESIPLFRAGAMVTSMLGAFGHGLRETRLTAALGYAIALAPDQFRSLLRLRGRISAVTLENQLDDGRSDIHIDTTVATTLIEAKTGAKNATAQAQRYPAKNRIVLSSYAPSPAERDLARCRFVSWREIAEVLDKLTKSGSPVMRVVCADVLGYMEEHNMIRRREPVEIYAREINEEATLQLFLHGRMYGCTFRETTRLPEALYFAPHFGRRISRIHPGVREGISYIARIEAVECAETWADLRQLVKDSRGRQWLWKHMSIFTNVPWIKKREKRSYLFLAEPHLVFNPPIRKMYLQSGSAWLSRNFFSFDEFFNAWKQEKVPQRNR
jgi:hypothetical protein